MMSGTAEASIVEGTDLPACFHKSVEALGVNSLPLVEHRAQCPSPTSLRTADVVTQLLNTGWGHMIQLVREHRFGKSASCLKQRRFIHLTLQRCGRSFESYAMPCH